MTDLAQLVLDLDLVAHIDPQQTRLSRLVFDNRKWLQPAARRAANLREVKIAQQSVEVIVQMMNAVQVGPGESELDKSVLDKVFGQFVVAASHLPRPERQLLVALNKEIRMRDRTGFGIKLHQEVPAPEANRLYLFDKWSEITLISRQRGKI